VCTTVLEVPSGYMSDRLGRKLTLMSACPLRCCSTVLLVLGEGFAQFALANMVLGAGGAFASGTDTSLLFESLKAEDRATEIEAAELRAWRFGFAALALSALTGGVFAQYDEILPFLATAIAAAVLLGMTALFREPPRATRRAHRENVRALGRSFTQPTLIWIFCLALVMYGFGHIPLCLRPAVHS
ncbi:MAG: MFS transporter, partial [Leptolyngbyaceae cyanobacterium CSU_1_4]|nr:MFS transporter [Leptolyngbyaceae cyanobacterium CSU_1_4]